MQEVNVHTEDCSAAKQHPQQASGSCAVCADVSTAIVPRVRIAVAMDTAGMQNVEGIIGEETGDLQEQFATRTGALLASPAEVRGTEPLPKRHVEEDGWMTDRTTTRGQGSAGRGPCRTPPIPTPPTTPREGSVGEAVYLQGRARATLPA